MRRLLPKRNFLLFPPMVAGLLAFAFPAAAGSLRIQVDRLTLGGASAGSVALALTESSNGRPQATVAVRNLQTGVGWHFDRLDWRCPIVQQAGSWQCAGDLEADRLARALAVAWDEAGLRAELSSGRSRLSVFGPAANPGEFRVAAAAVPVGWAQPFLATLWATAQPSKGRFSGELAIALGDGDALTTRASLRLVDIGLDTPDGALAAEGVSGELNVDYRAQAGQSRTALSGRLDGGELLFGNVYVGLSGASARWSATAVGQPDGRWSIPAFEWQDARILGLKGSGELDAAGGFSRLRLDATSADLTALAARYLSGPLGLAGLAGLAVSGAADVGVSIEDGQISEVLLESRSVQLADASGRFRFADLDGGVHWTAAASPRSGVISWASAGLHDIELGPARLSLTSRDRQIALDQAISVALLGGQLQLDQLRIQPPVGPGSATASMGFTVLNLDMRRLSQVLGWPAFEGSLNGRLPSARYADQKLNFDGGLSMQVFDGSVAIQRLVMERPFGVAPSIAADIVFSGLDLEPLTAAFGFGEITGRLQGAFRNLRLLDWQPVAFEASLRSDPDYKGRKRISQRAVQDISNIGGSGLAAGIQGGALRMFSTFGYARLGLSCTLANDVCLMDGVGSAGDGYTIVKGAGLPRVDVVGFQRRVDWPVLVARLKAATEGQTPLID
jgi:hypothetical protein